jgi:hypothetical protein
MPLVVEMFAKETRAVSADNVRAGLLRLIVYVYTKLSTAIGAGVDFSIAMTITCRLAALHEGECWL